MKDNLFESAQQAAKNLSVLFGTAFLKYESVTGLYFPTLGNVDESPGEIVEKYVNGRKVDK